MTTSRRPRLAPLALGAVLLASPFLAACGSDTAEDAAGTSASSSPTAGEPTTSPSTSGSASADPSAEASTSTDASPSAPATPSETAPTIPPGTPECASVWTAGGTIPEPYKGCAEDGTFVKADVLGCSSGQRIVRYADRFYGVPGGTISASDVKLIRDPGYRDTVAGCRG